MDDDTDTLTGREGHLRLLALGCLMGLVCGIFWRELFRLAATLI